MAQSTKPAEKAADTAKDVADKATEQGKHAMDQASEIGQETAERAEGGMRRGLQVVDRVTDAAVDLQRTVAERASGGATELGQSLTDLLKEQTRHNVEMWTTLLKTVDWNRVAQLQSEYLQASLTRAAKLTQHYFDVSQSVLVAANTTAQRQAKKAA